MQTSLMFLFIDRDYSSQFKGISEICVLFYTTSQIVLIMSVNAMNLEETLYLFQISQI